jgi:hypothetical protein
MSAASKIAMQMNVKAGHSLWYIENNHPIWRENSVAIAGLANSKGKQGSNVAFAGTTSQRLDEYFSDCKMIDNKNSNNSAVYQEMFTQWLQNWFKNNSKKLPNVLVFFR